MEKEEAYLSGRTQMALGIVLLFGIALAAAFLVYWVGTSKDAPGARAGSNSFALPSPPWAQTDPQEFSEKAWEFAAPEGAASPYRILVAESDKGEGEAGLVVDARDIGDAALRALLEPQGQTQLPSVGAFDLSSLYAFLPTGLISTDAFEEKERTPEQEALAAYGNAAGAVIRARTSAATEVAALESLFENRGDEGAAERVHTVARGLGDVGRKLGAFASTPAFAQSAHTDLAASYLALEEYLHVVAEAASGADEELISAVLEYNTHADSHARAFQVVVSLFVSYGVSFNAAEPGSVFMFTPL